MISFERRLQDHYTLRLQCRPIGNAPDAARVRELFRQLPEIIQFTNFYQGLLREQCIASFAEKDWNAVGVRLLVEDEDAGSEWPELMPFLKAWVLFGVCDLKEKSTIDLEEIAKFKRV